MKKLIALFLIFILLTSFAYAEIDENAILTYNSYALTLGAPALKDLERNDDQFVVYKFNSIKIGFELSPIGGIKNGFVYCDDDADVGDFLCSAMAMISFLGETDMTAFGMLLTQFGRIHSGQSSVAYTIGTDGFAIVDSKAAKYAFLYMNNDNKSN